MILPLDDPDPLIEICILWRHPFIAVLQSERAACYLIEWVLRVQTANHRSLVATLLPVELPQDLLPPSHKVETPK